MFTTLIAKFAMGFLMPVLVGIVKKAAPSLWAKIPDMIQPLVSAILGALASGGTTLVVDVAAGATSIVTSVAADAAIGAAGGASGKAVRDSATAGPFKFPWME